MFSNFNINFEFQLIETFNTHFNYECNIDDIQKHTGADGISNDNQTNVRAHFIDDKFEAVEASVIQSCVHNYIKLFIIIFIFCI